MPKLVVLNAGMTGRSLELKSDKTTIGRVEDNTHQIAEASISSHHCEVLLQGNQVVIKDLNSTNGTFINGEKIIEAVLKPGQTLRLGQVEIQLATEGSPVTPAPGATAAPETAAAAAKKLDKTMVMQRGVSLNELEQGPRTTGFDTSSRAFSKKSNQTNRLFLIVGGIIAFVILVVFVITFLNLKK